MAATDNSSLCRLAAITTTGFACEHHSCLSFLCRVKRDLQVPKARQDFPEPR